MPCHSELMAKIIIIIIHSNETGVAVVLVVLYDCVLAEISTLKLTKLIINHHLECYIVLSCLSVFEFLRNCDFTNFHFDWIKFTGFVACLNNKIILRWKLCELTIITWLSSPVYFRTIEKSNFRNNPPQCLLAE